MIRRTPSTPIRQLIAGIFIIATGCICVGYGQEYLVYFGPNIVLTVIGAILLVSGILLRLVAFLKIRDTHNIKQLVTTGVYSVVRNPIYLAFSGIVVGVAFLWPSVLAFIWALVSIFIMVGVAKLEEADLEKAFGEAYLTYKKEVPSFLPRFWKPRKSR